MVNMRFEKSLFTTAYSSSLSPSIQTAYNQFIPHPNQQFFPVHGSPESWETNGIIIAFHMIANNVGYGGFSVGPFGVHKSVQTANDEPASFSTSPLRVSCSIMRSTYGIHTSSEKKNLVFCLLISEGVPIK